MRPRLPPAEPFRVVFFDADSTLSAVEGIDELARRRGLEPQVAELTRRAMEGLVPLEDVYGLRLAMVQPCLGDVEWLAALYVEKMVPGAREVVAELTRRGKEVHVVSGGILQALLPLAAELGIPPGRVHAVPLFFDDHGGFLAHDEASPPCRSGGKAEACRLVLEASPGRSVVVGDGMTDMEARPPCDAAIGFGGVASRGAVREAADAWVEGPGLRGVLELLLTEKESSS